MSCEKIKINAAPAPSKTQGWDELSLELKLKTVRLLAQLAANLVLSRFYVKEEQTDAYSSNRP